MLYNKKTLYLRTCIIITPPRGCADAIKLVPNEMAPRHLKKEGKHQQGLLLGVGIDVEGNINFWLQDDVEIRNTNMTGSKFLRVAQLTDVFRVCDV